MGRKPKTPGAIPHLRVRKKGKKTFYYYDHGGKPRREEPLGCDYGLAIRRWAELRQAGNAKPAEVITFAYVANQYRVHVIPMKGLRTQLDNGKELKWLLEYFNDPPVPLDSIEPHHVKEYLKWRATPKTVTNKHGTVLPVKAGGKTRANREKALLSHIWNWAREEGYTSLPNPCAGVKGYKETGRDVYVEDDMFNAVYEEGDQALRDAMDLAYLTGQRVADTRAMDQRQVRDGFLHVRQGKTDAKRRIAIVGELADLLGRINARKAGYRVHSTRLIVDGDGQPLTERALRERFYNAREAAGIEKNAFQFRDLRAKAGTDKTDATDIREAQQQLGHSNLAMTEHYIRKRRGDKVTPTR